MADDPERDTEWRDRGRPAAEPHVPGHPPPPAAAPAPTVDGLAITGLVLGCVAVLFCWLPFFGAIAPILAIIFGGIGIGRKISRGMGTAGLVLGILTLIANIAITIFAVSEGVNAS